MDDKVDVTAGMAEPDWNSELQKTLIEIAGSNVIGFNLNTISKLVRATNYLTTQFKLAAQNGYEKSEVKSVIRATCEILGKDAPK